jgi:DNA adenine methylase|tara:strand:- start:2382 stop:3362 length:981 start_codon:yes stop_codon:yes gene_type:complete
MSSYIEENIKLNNNNNDNSIYITTMDKTKLQKPFLKWVGGKTQIIEEVLKTVPREINNYHEFFLGGGSVLFAILSLERIGDIVIKGNIYAYDYNKALISLYDNVKTNPRKIYHAICEHKYIFENITGTEVNRKPTNMNEATTSKESYYYWLRKCYNEIEDKCCIEASVLFMLLNKLCFRGLYREGPNGFNVPYGHYKNPSIITEQTIMEISSLLQKVTFKCCHFEESFNFVKPNDYIYCDPPYVPENKTSFVDYNSDGFTIKEHTSLFEKLVKLDKKYIRFSLSNSKVAMVKEYFHDGFQCQEVKARRAINSKNPESTTMEVIYYS